jgi:hypothetical protein
MHLTWTRWWRSLPLQDGTYLLIVLDWWRLLKWSTMGEPLERHIFTSPISPKIWQAPSLWYLLDARLELALWLVKPSLTSFNLVANIWLKHLPLEISYKYNSIQPLVHSECYNEKNHTWGLHALSPLTCFHSVFIPNIVGPLTVSRVSRRS